MAHNVYALNARICGTVSHHFEQLPMMIEAIPRVTRLISQILKSYVPKYCIYCRFILDGLTAFPLLFIVALIIYHGEHY